MLVLVAEDDPVARRILQITLENDGTRPLLCGSGEEAWQAWNEHKPRVILSDWMMPRMSGVDLCRKIRSAGDHDYTYFILVTAIGHDRAHLREAMAAGVDDFLNKPIDSESITMRLHVATRILEFTRQIRQLNQLLPICMYCRKIRDDADYWQQFESYIHTHTGSRFSHGICPECYAKAMKEIGLNPETIPTE